MFEARQKRTNAAFENFWVASSSAPGLGKSAIFSLFTWNNTEQAVQDTRAVHDAFVPFAAMSGAAGYPELLPDHRDWNKVKAIWPLYASLD